MPQPLNVRKSEQTSEPITSSSASLPTISAISVYPIKSTAGIALSNTWVDEFGLSFDRRFVLSDIRGQFITARTEPNLCLIQVSITATGLKITAPNMPPLTLAYQEFSAHFQNVTVWNDTINAQYGAKEYDRWFSQYLNKPCQLLYFGEQSQRFVKNSEKQVAFADGYPLLLISQASLVDLNQRCDLDLTMARFRPNIVVSGCEAFAEDGWQHIRIGEVEFEITKPCSRCTFTTLDPNTAQSNEAKEPLATLQSYRQVEKGDVLFGQNMVSLNQGQIKQGDTVTVLNRQNPPIFIGARAEKANSDKHLSNKISNKSTNSASKQANTQENKQARKVSKQSLSITFEPNGKTVKANRQQSILEQGEAAGLILPYSCRAGMCGRCKVKLNSGEVRELASQGLSKEDKQQGYILACSCIPITNIKVTSSQKR